MIGTNTYRFATQRMYASNASDSAHGSAWHWPSDSAAWADSKGVFAKLMDQPDGI